MVGAGQSKRCSLSMAPDLRYPEATEEALHPLESNPNPRVFHSINSLLLSLLSYVYSYLSFSLPMSPSITLTHSCFLYFHFLVFKNYLILKFMLVTKQDLAKWPFPSINLVDLPWSSFFVPDCSSILNFLLAFSTYHQIMEASWSHSSLQYVIKKRLVPN